MLRVPRSARPTHTEADTQLSPILITKLAFTKPLPTLPASSSLSRMEHSVSSGSGSSLLTLNSGSSSASGSFGQVPQIIITPIVPAAYPHPVFLCSPAATHTPSLLTPRVKRESPRALSWQCIRSLADQLACAERDFAGEVKRVRGCVSEARVWLDEWRVERCTIYQQAQK